MKQKCTLKQFAIQYLITGCDKVHNSGHGLNLDQTRKMVQKSTYSPLGEIQKISSGPICIGEIGNTRNSDYWGFEMFGKVDGRLPLTKANENIVPSTLAVLKPTETFRNGLKTYKDDTTSFSPFPHQGPETHSHGFPNHGFDNGIINRLINGIIALFG